MTRITPAASAWPKRWEESPATLGPFLTVTFAERPDLLVIQPSGRLDGASAPQFESLVMERIATHRAAVEFDLRKVRVITSAGLRVILMAARTLRNGDRAVTIEGLHGNTREVFETSGFLSLFPGQPSAAATVPVTVRSVRPYIRPGQEPPAPVTVAPSVHTILRPGRMDSPSLETSGTAIDFEVDAETVQSMSDRV